MSSGNDHNNILTFLRIKPSKRASGYITINDQEKDSLVFNKPPADQGSSNKEYINNTKLRYDYHFNGILDADATQDEVFKRVGSSAVQNAIDGFNSTIFAYGQTGSGKTFTLTGGPDSYGDRGIIPRSISLLFSEFRSRAAEAQFNVFVSYLEIYNEQGYDLLDKEADSKELTELPRVKMMEDEDGNFRFTNLSLNRVNSEEEALELLFEGDTNRAIAETPMNMVRHH